MKIKLLLTWPFFLILVGLAPLSAQQYSNDELIQMGNNAWQQTDCMKVGQFLFAYLLRNPAAVRNDLAYRGRLQSAIDWCERNTKVYADSKGDNPGKATAKPGINLVPPPSGQPRSALQKRCDIYGTMAAAQSTANLANGCRYTGTRWNLQYEFHYEYCLTAPPAEVISETQTRQQLLNQCAP
jgi:hypothetical protein